MLIYGLEHFHPYAARFLERRIDHAPQFLTKGIHIRWLWIEVDNEMERQLASFYEINLQSLLRADRSCRHRIARSPV